MNKRNKPIASSLDELDRIYLAAARNEDLSMYDVKPTPQNVALYWRIVFASRDISNSDNALQMPN